MQPSTERRSRQNTGTDRKDKSTVEVELSSVFDGIGLGAVLLGLGLGIGGCEMLSKWGDRPTSESSGISKEFETINARLSAIEEKLNGIPAPNPQK